MCVCICCTCSHFSSLSQDQTRPFADNKRESFLSHSLTHWFCASSLSLSRCINLLTLNRQHVSLMFRRWRRCPLSFWCKIATASSSSLWEWKSGGLKASRPMWFCRFSTRSPREHSRMFLICSRSFSLSSFATLSGSPLESQKWKKESLSPHGIQASTSSR